MRERKSLAIPCFLQAIGVAALLLSGCATETKKGTVVRMSDQLTPPPISVAEAESRAAKLASILENGNISEQDRQVAQNLLNSQELIRSHLDPPLAQGDVQRIARLLFENLIRLEEEYFKKEVFDDRAFPKVLESYASKRKEIIQAYLSGDHEGVINGCIGLQESFGKAGLTPEIGLLFSISLAKRGRFAEAIRLGETIIRETEGRPDLLHLRAHILEWQLASGQSKDAAESLEKLGRQVTEREALLKQARAMTRGEEEKPAEPAEVGATQEASPLQTKETQAFRPLDDLLAEVDGLIQKGEFTKAKFLLLQQRIRYPEGSETETIDQAMRKVEAAEKAPGQQAVGGGAQSDETEGIQIARKLIDEEKYEEAISVLEAAERELGALSGLRELKEAAVEKLINRERNKAAKLFLTARNTSDPARKLGLLQSSYGLLRSLIERFPTSSLADKVQDNMNRIKEEMDRVKGASG